MAEQKQCKLFDLPEWWESDWQDMPEFVQNDQTSFKSIIVHFKSREEMLAFSELVKQRITTETQSIWYPEAEIRRYADKRYIDES